VQSQAVPKVTCEGPVRQPDAVVPGKVIILNGTSSSGKTTIAHALQEALAEPYLCLGIDTFITMMPERYASLEPSDDPAVTTFVTRTDAAGPWVELKIGTVARRVSHSMYWAVAALANRGNNVIFDDVMTEPDFLQEAVMALRHLHVLFVGVRCPLAVAEERERERGDRLAGMARGLLDRGHGHVTYDLEVDTAQLSVEQCVEAVLRGLESTGRTSAFQRLSARTAHVDSDST
jgi:chloramphenicol 3-O phosphotransferase